MNTTFTHPAAHWQQAANKVEQTAHTRLRLAAMAGHMQIDKIAARRAALIDLLADGRPHQREEIWETVAASLDDDCWGKVPQEALARFGNVAPGRTSHCLLTTPGNCWVLFAISTAGTAVFTTIRIDQLGTHRSDRAVVGSREKPPCLCCCGFCPATKKAAAG